MKKEVEEIIKNLEELRKDYRNFTINGDLTRPSLIDFEGRFVDIKASVTRPLAYYTHMWTKYDDKSSTAFKFRIALSISEGRHPDFEICKMTPAEKYASSSKEYKEFIEKRATHREMYLSLREIKEDINAYINEIKDRIKTF